MEFGLWDFVRCRVIIILQQETLERLLIYSKFHGHSKKLALVNNFIWASQSPKHDEYVSVTQYQFCDAESLFLYISLSLFCYLCNVLAPCVDIGKGGSDVGTRDSLGGVFNLNRLHILPWLLTTFFGGKSPLSEVAVWIRKYSYYYRTYEL